MASENTGLLTVSIVTPGRRVVGPVSVRRITLPGGKGEMTILPGHARLLSTLETGILSFEQDNQKVTHAAVSHGFIEINDDGVTVLADTLELPEEIDADRARKAQERAESQLRAKENFEADMVKWQRKLQRAMTRQQLASLGKQHR